MFQDLIGLEGDDLAQLLHSAGEKYAFLSCLCLWYYLCTVVRVPHIILEVVEPIVALCI